MVPDAEINQCDFLFEQYIQIKINNIDVISNSTVNKLTRYIPTDIHPWWDGGLLQLNVDIV